MWKIHYIVGAIITCTICDVSNTLSETSDPPRVKPIGPETSSDPPGHNKPFGSHTEFINVTVLNEFPDPKTFFKEFAQRSQPFIVRSAMNAETFPAVEKWTDEYLREHLGNEDITAEQAKKEIRKLPIKLMKFSKFLQQYKESEMYMVHGLSDFVNKVKVIDDVHVPRSLFCGGLQHLIESVILWFSSGGTKSVFHSDDYENFNCVLDGTKELIFVDKAYAEQVTDSGWIVDGGYSKMDVDKVDMYKFPRLQEVPVQKAVLTKGDCLYIPYKWYHQVNSPGGRSLALNFWFLPTKWFNESDCVDTDLTMKTKPLKSFDIGNFYRGAWHSFLWMFEENETKETFSNKMKQEGISELDIEIPKMFDSLDKDGDDKLTLHELYTANHEYIMKTFPRLLEIFGNPELSENNFHDEL